MAYNALMKTFFKTLWEKWMEKLLSEPTGAEKVCGHCYHAAFDPKAPPFSLAVGVSVQVCDWPRASGSAEWGGSAHQSDSGAGETSERDDGAAVRPIRRWWWRGEHRTGLTSELVWACQHLSEQVNQPSRASWSRFKSIIHDSAMLQASTCYNLSHKIQQDETSSAGQKLYNQVTTCPVILKIILWTVGLHSSILSRDLLYIYFLTISYIWPYFSTFAAGQIIPSQNKYKWILSP